MFELFRNTLDFVKIDTPNRLVITLPCRVKINGLIFLFIALIAIGGLFRFNFGIFGGIITLIFGGLGVWVTPLFRTVIFDGDNQEILLVTRFLLLRRERRISSQDIRRFYLDYHQEDYTPSVPDLYGYERTKRIWAIYLVLMDGQSTAIVEKTLDHPSGQTAVFFEQLVFWKELTAKISKLMGKTFMQTTSVPGPPHTFVEEIDQIIQRRLDEGKANTQSIRVFSNNDGRLEIIVDGKAYHSINELNDVSTRNLITQAVEEWQNDNEC
jgi:hypothetical protein